MANLNCDTQINGNPDWSEEIRADLAKNFLNGRVGHELLSETDEVRIWRVSLKPGERIGFHRHVLNYFWVAVNAGSSQSRFADGRTLKSEYEAGTTRHFSYDRGEFMLHDLENIGETELIFTTVEFKDSPNSPLPV